MSFASLQDALEQSARGAIASAKANDIENLVNLIVMARPSLKDKAAAYAAAIRDGKVEAMTWQGAVKNCKTGSNYITFSDDANKFALWEASPGTGGTAGTNQASSNQLDVATWVGLYMNHDVQNLTFEEIERLGKVRVKYGEQNRPPRLMPLREFLINRITKEYRLGSTSAEINARLSFAGNSNERGGFRFDPKEPMVVVVGDSIPTLEITGLSGTMAGSTPTLTLQPHLKGWRVRL